MKIKIVDIDKVIPYERNPRRNEKAIDAVAASIKEFGWQQPIVVDSNMIILAGHTRLEAAKKLGLDKVPIHVAKDLTEAQAKAYRLADNKVSEAAEWDEELLKLELDDLKIEGFNLAVTGFSDEEMQKLLNAVTVLPPGEAPEPEEEKELPTPPDTVENDIYDLGQHRLICGDAAFESAYSVLGNDERADVLICTWALQGKSEAFSEAAADMLDALSFAGTFLKEKHSAFACISYGWKGFYADLEKLINETSKPGGIILDLNGSVETLEVAHRTGRMARLIQKDAKKCDAIMRRMRRLYPELIIRRNGEVIDFERNTD